MKQQDLAVSLQISHQAIYRYEQGLVNISGPRLYILANVLGVDIDYFFQDVHDTASVLETTPRLLTPESLAVLELMADLTRETRQALVVALRGFKGKA